MNLAKVFPKFSAVRLLSCVPKYHPSIFVSNHRCLSIAKQNESTLCTQNIQFSNMIQKRYKKKMFGKQSKSGSDKGREEDNDEEEDDDEDEDGGKGLEAVTHTSTPSLQLNVAGKILFNVSRGFFDECLNKNLLRVNGEIVRKNHLLVQNDEIDLIRGVHLEDPNKLEIRRVNLLAVDDKAASAGRTRISFQRYNNLIIDNYTTDPHEGV